MTRRLWYIDGRAYDLTPWLARHPGSRDPLIQAQGTDCTELFHSYHLMREPPPHLLARYEVQVDRGDPEHAPRLRGSHFTFADGDFYRTVQRRARAYFAERGLPTHASPLGQALSLLLVITAVLLLIPAFVYGSVIAALLVALLRILASVGPGHSMSHFSVFPRGPWNVMLVRLASPFLVSNPAIWSASHVRSHHVHPLTMDDMQDNYPLKRVQPAQTHRAWHRGQHLYAWLIYLFGLPLWALQDFVRSAASLVTGSHAGVTFTLSQRIENLLVTTANMVITLASPFIFLPWPRALLVFLLVNVVSSFFTVIQIMVNHEVPEAMGRVVPSAPIDWGVHQVVTSHNFAVDSKLALHFSGGLNMQIEHHLFPGVHYSHYPALARIVRQACVEFALPYHTSRSLGQAIAKHYDVLRRNSVP